MNLREAITQSRAKVEKLESELVAEKERLLNLELICTHQEEKLGVLKIRTLDDVIVHSMAQCLSCGARSFISKKKSTQKKLSEGCTTHIGSFLFTKFSLDW